jgi:TRAP-type C4-dicarboxylate transport system permease small subunit
MPRRFRWRKKISAKEAENMRVIKWLDKYFEEAVLVILLFIITMLTGLQVFMRYVMNSSLTWSEELNRYAQVWSGFLCLGYCIKRSSDIKIDMFVNMLPKTALKILRIIISVLSIALFAVFTKAAWGIISKILVSGQTSAALKMPMQYLYAAPFAGFGLGIIRLAQNIVCQFIPQEKNNGRASA